MNEQQLQIKLFNEWFTKRTKRYKQQREGKFCDTEIVIKHNAFTRTFNTCYKRFFKHYETRNDCFCDCIMLVWEGLQAFEIKDGSSWYDIANGLDPKNYGKLVTYLKSYVVHELERKLYPKVCTSKTVQTEEGKKQFLVYYNIEPESLNRLTKWKDEKEKIELINCMQESFWSANEEYKSSLFIEWAKQNLKTKLSKTQQEFLETLENANYSKLDKDYDEQLIGLKRNLIQQRLKRIYNKLATEYKKEQKFLTGGFAIQSLNAELKTHTKITNIVYGDYPNNEINSRVSLQILKSLQNNHFAKLIYDKLDDKDLKTVIRCYQYSVIADEKDIQLFADYAKIPTRIIYDIVEIVENRIEFLELRINEELAILDEQAKSQNLKVDLVQFPIDPNKRCVHLRMNSYGIAVPKYE